MGIKLSWHFLSLFQRARDLKTNTAKKEKERKKKDVTLNDSFLPRRERQKGNLTCESLRFGFQIYIYIPEK